jgi:hypothetical protein
VTLDSTSIKATASALTAISQADLLVLGPGSLFTSLIPHLLVPEIRAALASRRAPLVWVANVDEQEGETEGLDLDAHLDALIEHGGAGLIDLVLAAAISRRGAADPGLQLQPRFVRAASPSGELRPPIIVRSIASKVRPHLHDSLLLAHAVLKLKPTLRTVVR